jgi:hypothetical protein
MVTLSNVTMRSRTALQSTLGYVLIIYRLKVGLYKEKEESVRHKERDLTRTQNITLTELEFSSNTTNTLP